MEGLLGSDGSLLVPVTLKKASGEPASVGTLTVATVTSLPFGGQSEQVADTGIPLIVGAAMSILTACETEAVRPAPLVAEHVAVPLAVKVDGAHAGETTPDSGSATPHVTVTALVYQPPVPTAPVMAGTMTGGVVSIRMAFVTELLKSTPFVAVQVTGAVAVSVTGPQPADEAIPLSGSLRLQLSETLPGYHPPGPAVPASWGTITGGVVSVGLTTKRKP